MASRALYPSSLSHPETLDATIASRALTTIYSKLLNRMAVCSLRTFASSDSNSESDIPTNNLDSDSLSKQLHHAEGTKNRAFNRFLKEVPAFSSKSCKVMKDKKYARLDMAGTRKRGLNLRVSGNSLQDKAVEEVDDDHLSAEEYRRSYYGNIDLPQSRYKMGEVVTELKNIMFNMKPQMMMRNTCDSRRWFTSCGAAVSDAANVESNAFSTNAAGYAINGEGPEGEFPNINIYAADRRRFFEQKHSIMLENFGLFRKGNIDWYVAQGSKFRYISIEDFIWWFDRIPKKSEETIYNYMYNQQIYVLESCPEPLLKRPVFMCFWELPREGWFKLNVSGIFKEKLGGTKEAFCGDVLRDCSGSIFGIFHKPFPDATSRDEVLLLGLHHGINEILQRRSRAKRIILEFDHKEMVKVLRRGKPYATGEYMELYHKIFDMLLKFDEYEISFQFPQGNAVAYRVAYIASHLTVGQNFPKNDRCFEKLVWQDRWNIPRYVFFPKERYGIEELSDDDDILFFLTVGEVPAR
ncbi:uncharacterized protein LOC132276961 [Cornus florida]|uniref:uncharacterized protein LOC132276961 n=1 Tax=Cornus florida TaxID=4283 RepID=UPI0028995029|nr:uncharacterized protein LOC132276961 [Cornus florida]